MKHLKHFANAQEAAIVLATWPVDTISSIEGHEGVRFSEGVPPGPVYSIPFYVENITNGVETLTIVGHDWTEQDNYLEIPVEYSLDGTTWSSFGTTGETPLTRTLQPGDKVYLRATTNTWYERQEEQSIERNCNISGVSKVGGNIMSLLYGSNFTGNETAFSTGSSNNFMSLFNDFNDEEGCNRNLISASELILPATALTVECYSEMFFACTSLTTAPALPATTLVDYCYSGMFTECSSLTTASALPATELAQGCYNSMFYGCTSLTTASALPATELAEECYSSMFYGCSALTTAPALPATELVEGCYTSMFSGCTSLTTAPALPATTLADWCYNNMFNSCTSLTTAPALPATTLTESCYAGMFNNCTSLTTAPELQATTMVRSCYNAMFMCCTSLVTAPALSATTLANNCYAGMFSGCTSLTSAPALPATTLADYCYSELFYGCTSLTTAPELPAATLADYCYIGMFTNCTSLNYIKCLATDISAAGCTNRWTDNLAATGTFVKDSSMTRWKTDFNGIPSGWTVQDAA